MRDREYEFGDLDTMREAFVKAMHMRDEDMDWPIVREEEEVV